MCNNENESIEILNNPEYDMNVKQTYDGVLFELQNNPDYNDMQKLQKFTACSLVLLRTLTLHYNDRCNDDNYRDDKKFNDCANIFLNYENDRKLQNEFDEFDMLAYNHDNRSIYVK